MSYQLRPYQLAAVQAGANAINGACGAGLLVEPTGAGKSLVIANIVAQVGGPVLVFQPSKEILKQNASKMLAYGFEPAIYSASMKAKDIGDITLATIQSVHRSVDQFRDVRTVIIDECDLVNPKGGMYHDFIAAMPQARVLGLTATPFRLSIDGYGGAQMKFLTRTRPRIFTDVAHVTQIPALYRQGFLSPVVYHRIRGFDPTKVKVNSGADYDDRSVQLHFAEIGFRATLARVVERLLAAGRKHILVFTRFTDDSEDLCRRVPETRTVSGTTPARERDGIIDDFRSGRVPVVSNVGVLTAGFDFPELDTVVLARPTQSLRVYMQCLDSETEILTPTGWSRIDDDVSIAAAYDPDTGAIAWRMAEKMVRPLGDEAMWGIQSPHLDIRVTSGHRMLFSARHPSGHGPLRFRRADELRGFGRIPVSGQQFAAGAPLTDDELTFLGLYLSDGAYNRATGAVHLFQSEANPGVIRLIEATLNRCGLKFGHSVNRKPSNFGERKPLHQWTVSFGKARGRDSHLHGWGERFVEWIDEDGKQLSAGYDRLTASQLWTLLLGLYAGDGSKTQRIDWTRRSYMIAMGRNRVLADQLQALAVRRGFRCNVSDISYGVYLHVSTAKKSFWSLAVRAQDSRPTWRQLPCDPNERVWCVSVPTGAIVTRRNGKVAIVGNCVGRVVRPHPAKPVAWVVDMVEAVQTFGRMEEYQLRPGGPSGTKWAFVTADGREITNAYIDGGAKARESQRLKELYGGHSRW